MFETLRNRRAGLQAEISDTTTSSDGPPLSFTGRLARWSATHRWWVVAGSVLVLLMAMFVSSSVEIKELDYQGEGDSATGAELIDDRFENSAPPTEQLVFSNPSLDSADPAFRTIVQELTGDLRALPEVESVVSFYDTGDEGMVSADGHAVLARVEIATDSGEPEDNIDAIVNTIRTADKDAPGFEIAVAGDTSLNKELERIDEEDFAIMIMVTMIVALTFMLIAFRAVVAAVLPLVLAIGAIFTAIGIATLVSHVYPMVDFLAQVVLLMGMAVGVGTTRCSSSVAIVTSARPAGPRSTP